MKNDNDERLDDILSKAEKALEDIQLKNERRKIPVDIYSPWARSTKSETRIELKAADRALLAYIRQGANMGGDEKKALVEDAEGQYLVSPAIEAELQRSLANLVVVRQLSSKRTIDKDRIKVRDITEASVAWGKLETGTEITESDPTPGVPADKYAEDLYGLAKIGEDELTDSDTDLAVFIADSFSRAIAEKENLGFLKGAGHASSEPEGICVDATLVAATKTTASTGAVTVEDFMQMIYEVPAKYRKGSAWIVNSTVELELRKLRAGGSTVTDGPFLWQPSLISGTPPEFLGYPIHSQDEMDDLSDTAGVIAIFGNFQYGYRILDRQGITLQRLSEIYALAGMVGFKIHARIGGYLMRPSNKALVLLKEKA
jgi:HK97 family phage major capsid protein